MKRDTEDHSKTGFIKTELDLLTIPGLHPRLRELYGRLRFYAGNAGVCRAKHKTLAQEIGLTSDRHMRRLIEKLHQLHLIEWDRGRYANTYRVLNPDRTWIASQIGHECPTSEDQIGHPCPTSDDPDRTSKSYVIGRASPISYFLKEDIKREEAAAAANGTPSTLQESSSSNQEKKLKTSEPDGNPAVKLVRELAATHPRTGSVEKAIKAVEWIGYSDELRDRMRHMHPVYCEHYAKFSPSFVPDLARWIGDGDWRREPEIPKKTVTQEEFIADVDAGIKAALARKAKSNAR